MKLIYFFSLFFILIVSLSFAQDDQAVQNNKTSTLVAAIGVNDLHIKDNYISSEIFQGLLFSANISFMIKSKSDAHEIDIYYTTGEPDFRDGTWNVNENSGYVAYGYTHHLKSLDLWNNQLNLSAGGGISSCLMSTELRKTENITGETLFFDQSWYWAHNINLIVQGSYDFGNHNISLKLDMPVFKVAARPENGHNLSSSNNEVIKESFWNAAAKGKPGFIWDNFIMNFKVEYRLPLSESIELNTRYLFSYTSSENPDPFSLGMYMNNFLLGIGFNF